MLDLSKNVMWTLRGHPLQVATRLMFILLGPLPGIVSPLWGRQDKMIYTPVSDGTAIPGNLSLTFYLMAVLPFHLHLHRTYVMANLLVLA